jgi:hypothetical protein
MINGVRVRDYSVELNNLNANNGPVAVGFRRAAVVGDPAANARVLHFGQLLQGLVAATMKRPAPNRSADGRQRFRTHYGSVAMMAVTAAN